MDIRGVDFVAYSTKDMSRAVKFYEDTLGLTVAERFEDKYAEFDVAGTAFGLYRSQDGPTGGTIAFNVPNMAEALAQMKAKGLEPAWAEETPVCRMAGFIDPDGNHFMLHEKPKV